MSHCGNCENCSGCAATLELTKPELDLLDKLAQFAFLPVFRRADDMTPIYLEDKDYSVEDYSILLQLLEKKMLISIDYGKALSPAPAEFPVGGSVGLTQRGQQVIELLQTQGLG